MRTQQGNSLGRQARFGATVPAAVFCQEEFTQQINVAVSFAEGRNLDRNDIQPVVKIAPEFFFIDTSQEVGIGRGDDPHINGNGVVTADTINLPFLDDPQELRLQMYIHFSDLIQQKRPVIGQFELAELSLAGSRKGTFLISEHLALEEVVRYRRTIHGDKGHRIPITLPMDMPGKKLLSRAAFSLDKNARLAFRHPLEHPQNGQNLFIPRDDSALPRHRRSFGGHILFTRPNWMAARRSLQPSPFAPE